VIAHDGFTLADMVAYNEKHNEHNGEDNRELGRGGGAGGGSHLGLAAVGCTCQAGSLLG
jgi:hypothetical protein